MSFKIFKKTLSVILTLNLLLQSFSPYLVGLAYADDSTPSADTQEVTPTPTAEPTPETTPEVTPTPAEEVTPAPTSEPTPVIAPEETPSPTVEVTPSIEPTPTEEVVITPEPASNTESQAPPSDSVIPTEVEESQTTVTSIPETISTATQLEQTLTPQPTLTSDKADYFPTDIAYISGTGFNSNETYTLHITSSDNPFVSTYVEVTSDENGQFTYAYQLDGHYRPNYSVDTIDAGDSIVASMSFTDSNWQQIVDSAGANDEPGQKDLTLLSRDLDSSNPLLVNWNWDEIKMSGNNTADGCALFDTNNNGLANYALCAQWQGDQVQVSGSPYLYSCSDTRSDRCGSATPVTITNGSSSCSISSISNDPFNGTGQNKGDAYPKDTQAACSVNLADVGGATNTSLLDVCSYPSGQPNSDPSDCIVIRTDKGHLSIIKDVSPDAPSSNWNFTVTGPTSFSTSIAGDGSSGTTNVDLGTYSITESAGVNTSLNEYTTSWSCTKNSSPFISGNGTTISNLIISKDGNTEDSTVCIFNNTVNNGTLIVKKVLPNDNGGTATTNQFSFNYGTGPIPFESDGQNDITVTPGTYTITETNPMSGYAVSYNNCSNLIVPAGGSATCTITNNDNQSFIIVDKTVVNDNGGTADPDDFSLTVGGNAVLDGISYPVNPGTYTVGETNLPGYTAGSWGGSCNANGSVIVGLGETKTCTITNDDNAPLLNVIKIVDNGNTGAIFTAGNFQMKVDNVNVTQNVSYPYSVGNHSVSESGPIGYTTTFSESCPNGVVSLALGDDKTCRVTNTAIAPTLTLTKTVENNNGGTKVALDFQVKIDGSNVAWSTPVITTVGSHTASEITVTGYTPSVWGTNCASDGTITLALGENKTCSITNDDQPAQLTVVKDVLNPDNNPVTDLRKFSVTVGTQTDSLFGEGDNAVFNINAGTFTVSEGIDSDYEFVSISEDSDAITSGYQVTLNPGENKTITVVNKQKKATITVTKDVIKSDLSIVSDNHLFFVTLNSILQGFSENTNAVYSVNPGTYSAVESVDSNYTEHSNESPVTVGSNGSATIKITNKQNPGSISGHKYDTNSSTPLSGWTINLLNCSVDFSSCVIGATDTTDTNGLYEFTNLISGNYRIQEVMQTGWTNISPVSIDTTISAGTVLGEQNFTNFKLGVITGHKFNDLNGNHAKDINEPWLSGWTIYLDQNNNSQLDINETSTVTDVNGSYSFGDLPAGDYHVREVIQNGWVQTSPEADGSYLVTIVSGSVIENRDFGNFQKATIIVHKNVKGTDSVSDPIDSTVFKVKLDGSSETSLSESLDATFSNLTPGTYTITESTPPTGYSLVSISDNGIVNVTSGGVHNVYIINKQVSANLIVIKHVTNDNGGNASASAFTMNVTGTNLSDSSFPGNENGTTITLDASNYTVDEATASGYTKSIGQNCSGTIAFGETKTCTITNDDEQSYIIVNKTVINNNGGNAIANDFSLTVDANPVLDEVSYAVNPGNHVVGETNLDGYTAGTWAGDCNTQGGVTIALGETKTCTITNDDQAGHLLVHKITNPSDRITEFSITASGSSEIVDASRAITGGATINYSVDAGTYSVTEQSVEGWMESSNTCKDITIGIGDTKECTITNTELGKIIVIKEINLEENQTSFNFDSSYYENSFSLSGGQSNESGYLIPGNYSVTEETTEGWNLTDSYCSNQDSPSAITLSAGQTVTCTFTNEFVEPTLQISKFNDAITSETPGGSVIYTILVNVLGSNVHDLTVKDLLPKGFVYRLGSYKIFKGGVDVTDLYPTEPTYHSPGTWTIDEAIVGEEIRLVYTADISSSQLPGKYKDLAFAQGKSAIDAPVIALAQTAQTEGFVSTNFSGTNVDVVKDQSRNDDYSVEKKEEVIGQVLGASTLPDTGANELWLLASLLSLYFGIKLIRSSQEK